MNENFLNAGKKLARVFAKTLDEIQTGVSLAEVESRAIEYIKEEGGKPGFKTVKNYNWATCININQGVVHGIPDNKKVAAGDVVSLDMGLVYKGWHSDMAYTKQIRPARQSLEPKATAGGNSKSARPRRDRGDPSPTGRGREAGEIRNKKIIKFLETGKKTLEQAIGQVKPGNRVGHISRTIQETIQSQGYSVFRRLTGHGIGRKLHQDPLIPGFLNRPIERTPQLEEGMGLAIEVIYTLGKGQLKTASDGWTIVTRDGKIAALFEKTVLVTNKGAKIITPYLFSGGN